jgi:tetratricopeptide (TPR) repeat protein
MSVFAWLADYLEGTIHSAARTAGQRIVRPAMVSSLMLRPPQRRPILTALALVAGAAAGCVFGQPAPVSPAILSPAAASAPNRDGYVGSAACARCHQGIARSFAKSSMGHSLTAITPEFLRTLPLGSPDATSFFDPKSNHHFEVRAEDGKLIESEYETEANGKQVFRSTHEMGWIIGTGENGFGALLRRGDYLFQAPLSYYTRAARWNLSPGYQNGDDAFNRIIQPGCIYCHSGRPQPIAGHNGRYLDPAFTQISVGCENCHGPGAAHVEAMRKGEFAKDGPESAIVNPERLPGQLADDICMSCHQAGDARVLEPGKTYQDFRPGEPLERTVLIFQIPPTRDNPPNEDHVEHYYSMSLSKCFLATRNLPAGKQLRCISCHDPHVEPTKEEAPAYFKSKCLTCHTAASCTAPRAARQSTTPSDNCIGCHMPQRDIRVISHSTATNHRIVRTPDEPFPDQTFNQTTSAMPDLIELDPAGKRGAAAAAPPALIRLQAYSLLKGEGKTQYLQPWLETLAELEKSNPENAIVQASLGHHDLEEHAYAEAISHLEHSLELDPLQPWVYVDLSAAQDQSGKHEEAILSAKKAVLLEPFNPGIRKTLIYMLIEDKQYDQVEAEMEEYLKMFPEDDLMRKMLAIARQ